VYVVRVRVGRVLALGGCAHRSYRGDMRIVHGCVACNLRVACGAAFCVAGGGGAPRFMCAFEGLRVLRQLRARRAAQQVALLCAAVGRGFQYSSGGADRGCTCGFVRADVGATRG
jgi:hypothetical protein